MLFCDLAGFTAHTERADPEDVRSRLNAFHAAVRGDVERFGGRVEKLMGDGVFAVFGAPTAHEDDPERAVMAALRILESIEELNAHQEHDLTVRVAVTTGEAIVQLTERQDYEGIVGDVVNTASRLEAVAAPGTIVADERTYRASRHSIEFSPLEPVALKGKSEEVAIWRAEEAKSRFGVGLDDAVDTPFVGREDELDLLIDAFERTLARRTPQLVTITGEPGAGKSRLVDEFRHRIDDRDDLAFWRQGRCLPYGEGVSYWAISEIVKAHAGILESEAPASAEPKLEQAVRALIDDPEEADWVNTRLRQLVGFGGATDRTERDELFAAWTRFFESLAARNPLVLVIEDLHWADDPVIEFLDHLTEWASDSPILLLTTARPELYTDRPEWGAGKRDAVSVSLTALSDREASALLAALSDRPAMSADLQTQLLARSGGNPLYMTEYVRLAIEQDWFGKFDRGEELPLPDSVQAIIAARLDLLSSEDKALVQAAAVIGRVFWSGALSFAGLGTLDDVRARVRRLVRRELVRPVRRSSMQGQEEFAFTHVLIRDVTYARLTRDERGRLHQAAAQWLEAVSGERLNDVAELVAHHLATAYELSAVDDSAMRNRIYRLLMTASERALVLDAQAALRLSRRAAEFASDDRELGRALLAGRDGLHDLSEAVAESENAVEVFRRARDQEGELDALVWLSRGLWLSANSEEADEVIDRVLALARHAAAQPGRGRRTRGGRVGPAAARPGRTGVGPGGTRPGRGKSDRRHEELLARVGDPRQLPHSDGARVGRRRRGRGAAHPARPQRCRCHEHLQQPRDLSQRHR